MRPAVDGLHIPGVLIREEVGRGADSVVYRAERDGASYAVKVQRADKVSPEQDSLRRFHAEASVLARVPHPSLPSIMEIGEAAGRAYIIMEHLGGGTLAATLKERALPERRIVRIGRSLALALGSVHRRGLVHRDVKPQNVVLADSGEVKLIDFGFVERRRIGTDSAGAASVTVGTFRYSAPEQMGVLKRPVDGRADLYALGVLLFEAAAGRPPFVSDDVSELLRQHAAVRAPELRTVQSEVSPALEAVVARLLAKDPDDRYQSGESLAADLGRLDEINAAMAAGRVWSKDEVDLRIDARHDMTLVGRKDELRELRKHWTTTLEGAGRAVVLEGLAGVGKSRLVRELLRMAVQDDALVLSGKCATADPTPFGPLRSALDEWLAGARQEADAESGRSIQQGVLEAAGDAAPLLRRLSPRLAAALPATELLEDGQDSSDQFYEAIARFLVTLARRRGKAVLFVDDLQWSDEVTLRVLQRLVEHLADAPLLVVLTIRSDAPSLEQVPPCLKGLTERLAARHVLGPLDEPAIAAFVQAYLGNARFPDALVTSLARNTGGIPFALSEYLHALITAGLLKPHWGSWTFDEHGIEAIELPHYVIDLVERRIAELSVPVRQLLAAAAVVGHRFLQPVVGSVSGLSVDETEMAIEHALSAGVVTPAGGDEFVFVHDRLREGLLNQLQQAKRRELHGRIAAALEQTGEGATTHVYAVAHHRYMGSDPEAPETLEGPYAANLRGARAAAATHAFDQAYLFYQQAAELAAWAGLAPEPAVDRAHGQVCAYTGRLDEAADLFDRALQQAEDPVQRAGLRLARSQVAMGRLDAVTAREEVELAFKELNKSATRPRRLALWGFLRRLWGYEVSFLEPAPSELPPKERSRRVIERLLFRLQTHYGEVCYFDVDRAGVMRAFVRSSPYVSRLGVSSDLVHWGASSGTVVAIAGQERLARRLQRRTMELAQQLRDPIETARARLFEAYTNHFIGRPLAAQKLLLACLEQHGSWLPNQQFLSGAADLMWNLMMRGYVREARHWLEAGQRRVALARVRSEVTVGHTYRCYAGPVLAMLGKAAEGAQHLAQFGEHLAAPPSDRWRRASYLSHSVLYYAEQAETGEAFEQLAQEYEQLGLNPRTVPLHLKQVYLGQALVRLLQYERAIAHGCDATRGARARCRKALAQFTRAAAHPTLNAHLLVAKARFARLEGRHRAAHKLLLAAMTAAWDTDNAWVFFEVARERAYWLLAQGHQAAAKREAEGAFELAVRHGWSPRANRVRKEFELDTASVTHSTVSSQVGTSSTIVPASLQTGRNFESLLRVSLASASVLDPTMQARAALNELITILGAERGFLFVQDDDKSLCLRAARDSSGNELAAESDYSRSAVDRVCTTQKPVVLSGMEQLDASGASSVVMHNLRSVVAAPLLFRDRVVGAVYLDNRLARGVFTEDDVAILMAIANHIAIAVETGRAAQREAQARADRAERRIAERMRTLGRVLNSTLDLDELLPRFLGALAETLALDGAAVIVRQGGGLRVAAGHGFGSSEDPGGRQLPVDKDPWLAAALEAGPSVIASDSPGALALDGYFGTGGGCRWVVAPLTSRGEPIGMLAVAAAATGDLGQADAQLVFAAATQAATAIDNARLFGSVQRQANTDGLTGAHNRRFFMQQAEQGLQRALTRGVPLSLAMVDVDFFKRINDTHGHVAGDEVLRQVVKRIGAAIRGEDLLGRYGGEEFALLLPETARDGGLQVAERVRGAIEAAAVLVGHVAISPTVSVGLATLGGSIRDLAALIQQADAALYRAKQTGRNRVVVAVDDTDTAGR